MEREMRSKKGSPISTSRIVLYESGCKISFLKSPETERGRIGKTECARFRRKPEARSYATDLLATQQQARREWARARKSDGNSVLIGISALSERGREFARLLNKGVTRL